MSKRLVRSFSRKIFLEKVLLIMMFIYLLMIIGLIIVFLVKEKLDDGYIVLESKEYIANEKLNISEDEVEVTKNTEYLKNGKYKITYNTHYQNKDNSQMFKENSTLTIIDKIGKGYILDQENILINGTKYNISNTVTKPDDSFIASGVSINNDGTISAESGIIIKYKDNVLSISMPSSAMQMIKAEIYITLKERKTHYKYVTSEECYYNFIPSTENDFYHKKSSQSYVIEGLGYMLLEGK